MGASLSDSNSNRPGHASESILLRPVVSWPGSTIDRLPSSTTQSPTPSCSISLDTINFPPSCSSVLPMDHQPVNASREEFPASTSLVSSYVPSPTPQHIRRTAPFGLHSIPQPAQHDIIACNISKQSTKHSELEQPVHTSSRVSSSTSLRQNMMPQEHAPMHHAVSEVVSKKRSISNLLSETPLAAAEQFRPPMKTSNYISKNHPMQRANIRLGSSGSAPSSIPSKTRLSYGSIHTATNRVAVDLIKARGHHHYRKAVASSMVSLFACPYVEPFVIIIYSLVGNLDLSGMDKMAAMTLTLLDRIQLPGERQIYVEFSCGINTKQCQKECQDAIDQSRRLVHIVIIFTRVTS